MSSYPYKAVATLKYRPPPAQGPQSISFDKGSFIKVLGSADEDGDWLEGENDQGIKGVFPATFIQRVEEEEEAQKSDEVEGGGEGSTTKEEELDAPTETTQPKAEVPEPTTIEQAAANVSSATSPPPQPTSPATISDTTPSSASITSPKPTPAKSTPPPPAKKPNALAARIAAFNQSQQTAPASAPVPRPKPASKWSVDTSSSASATSPPPAPSAVISSPPPSSAPSLQPETDSTGKPKEFSAEDAKESIGRGGGSLKDRIKALQGLQIDQPAPPGRPPKPWKKKSVEEETPEQVETTDSAAVAESEKNLDDTVVKDQEPKHDVEQVEESVPEIPSFAPAEASTEELGESIEKEGSSKNEVEENSGGAKEEEKSIESNQETASAVPSRMSEPPSGKPSSIDLLAIAADSTPVVMTPGSASLEAPTDPSPFIPSTDKPPVSPQNEEQTVDGEEDSEAAKKQAIVARMQGLGGQKMGGVPIPALPKKAAGPRRAPRGGAKTATPAPAPEKEEDSKPVEPQEVEIEQTRVRESQEQPQETAHVKSPTEHLGSKDVEAETVQPDVEGEGKKEDILASMGGASSLLQNDEDEEDENSKKGFDDDDDFDTPAPPPPSRPAVPPPVTRAEGSFEDPKLDEGEEQVGEEEFAQRDEPLHDEATLGEKAVETLPTPATADPTVDDTSSQDREIGEPAAPPRVPLNRPPVPPSFVRQVTDDPSKDDLRAHRFTADIDNADAGSRSSAPPPPTRPVHAPPIAAGHETVTDEPRPSAHGPDEVAPTPPDSQPHSPQPVPADLAGFEIPEEGQSQKLPIPRHPAPPQHEKVTTDAEDRIMNETEVVTPPQEAFDESTAAPELDAPSVLDLAEVRDSHPESTELAEQALPPQTRKEGELSPAPVASPVRSPRPSSPQAQMAEESEEDEEDEDPEVARRRAIAARMAKLGGGRGMMMGMMPMGGMAPKPKKAKKPKAEDEETTRDLEARDLAEQVVESQSSGTVTPDHPARRYGGMPMGGFALPGIAALRPVHDEPTEESNRVEPDEKAQPEEEIETPIAEVPEEEEEEEEQESVPPPLPAGRPLSMPPRRSVPIPEPEATEADEDADEENNSEQTEEYVAEPQHEEEMAPPPPPPARPVGGHQNSLPPNSSPLSPSSAVPSSPPSRPIPTPSKRDSTFSLGRSTTRSSHRSSTLPPNAASMGFASPRQSLDLAFDSERVQGGGAAQGSYLARDVDLDAQTGNAWWRAPNGLPRALQGRNDVAFDLLSETPGNSRHEKELQVLYQDYSSTIISIAFDPSDSTETSTSLSQNHFPPPGKPTLDVLSRYSSSIGAQIFAAAHLKSNDRSARGMTDAQFVDFCFSRATDPVPRIGPVCGAVVYEASSEGKKGAAYSLEDEPRAGDVVSFRDVKLKATLGSKTVGSHLAIVSGFEDKKAKLRVLEVDKNGGIEEGSYKLDDLKQGTITVYRVMAKDFLR